MAPKFTDSMRYPYGYVSSRETDIRKTFRRAAALLKKNNDEAKEKVRELPKRTART